MEWRALLDAIRKPPVVPSPVIMPDFFVDHFVVGASLSDFLKDLERLAHQGGGNLIGTRHLIKRGGNAVNTASALLKLGVSPVLIVKTSPQGFSLLRALADPSLSLDHVHTTGSLSSTVSIETDFQGRRVNLMVSDSGSAKDFSIDDLDDDDVDAIRGSGLVALLCLNHNRDPSGLASDVFSLVQQESEAIKFIDIGDPSGRPEILPALVDEVLRADLVDVLSVNENEVQWLAHVIEGRSGEVPADGSPDEWLESARAVSRETGVRVDLHTPYYAASIMGRNETMVPTFAVEPLITCGAGDTWNAGDILGLLLNLEPHDRLVLANSVASLYVSSPDASHPTRKSVEAFLRTSPKTRQQQ